MDLFFILFSMNKQQTKAFTLVELIVVITILAILGTIAFISLQGYSRDSRDSVRIADVGNMKTSLELFHLNAGKYPLPDNAETVTYSGGILWYQGTFWEQVTGNVSRNLSEVPKDPLMDKEYMYSVHNNKNELQILALLEGDVTSMNSMNSVHAGNIAVTPRLDGNYNGLFVKNSSSIVPIPSIMTALDVSGGMVLDGTNIDSMITHLWDNIPEIGNVASNTWGITGINFTPYDGTITSNSTDEEKVAVMNAIKTTYSGSSLENTGIIADALETSGTGEITAFVDMAVLNNGSSTATSSSSSTSSSGGPTPSGNDANTVLLLSSNFDYSVYPSSDTFETKNTNYWSFSEDAWTITSESNQLKINIPNNGGSTPWSWASNTSKFKLNWDFEVVLDIDSSWVTSNADGVQSHLRAYIDGKWYTWWDQRMSGTNNFIFYTNAWAGAWTGNATNYNPVTSYKMIRTWGTLTMQYLNANVWGRTTFYTSSVGYWNASVWISMYPDASWSTANHNSYFDNFQVNAGTIVSDVFEDSSASAHSLTINWDTFHSTSQKKFWSTSMYFDGSGDYISIADSDDFDFGSWDFTIDFWMKVNTLSSWPILWRRWTNRSWMFYQINDKIYFTASSNWINWDMTIDLWNVAWTLTNGTWQHITTVRNWDNWSFYIDWVAIDNQTISWTIYNSSEPLHIWWDDENGTWYYSDTYIDELRISKWVARWTSNFTPPTSAY